MSKMSRRFAVVGMLPVLALGLSPAKAAPGGDLPLSVCSTDRIFSTNPTPANPYFPLNSNLDGVLVGPDGDETHGLAITVRPESENVEMHFGSTTVVTRVVREFEWVDVNLDGVWNGLPTEKPVEDSYNYFAQTGGTVCYFGEQVFTVFDSAGQHTDVLSSGSWRADDHQSPDCGHPEEFNAPGIFMPANPKPGVQYQQEFAPCVAQDVAQVVGSGTITLRNGTSFPNAIRTKEGSLIEKKAKEYKAYTSSPSDASLRGLIIDDGLQLCTPGPNENCE